MKWKKQVGAIVLVAVVIILAVAFFIPRNKEIPASVVGCYRSNNAPSIVIERDSLNIDQDGIGGTSASYRKDNVGYAILTSEPLLLKPTSTGSYRFSIEDKAARYIRFLPGPPLALEIIASDGMVVSYRPVKCDGSAASVR